MMRAFWSVKEAGVVQKCPVRDSRCFNFQGLFSPFIEFDVQE